MSNPHTLEELENNMKEEIIKILEAELQRVNQIVFTLQRLFNSEHLQHLL
jgi:hypothetical protein